MTRRRAKTVVHRVNPSADWTRSDHFVAPSGRHLTPGVEFSVRGERGRFRFVEHVLTEKGVEWISAIGGPRGVKTWRAFRPERIRRVHTKRTALTTEETKALLREKRAQKRSPR